MNFYFDIAGSSDAQKIVELVNSVYRGERAHQQAWTTEAGILGGQRCDEQMIDEMISSRDHVVILARDVGTKSLVGCVHLEIKGDTSYLGMLSVSLDHQKKGLASKILEYSEKFSVSSWGAKKIEIDVIHLRTELIEFYKRKGFRLTGEHREFPYGNERYGVPLREDLYFVVMEKNLTIS